jgi:hypothetical protein
MDEKKIVEAAITAHRILGDWEHDPASNLDVILEVLEILDIAINNDESEKECR